MSKRDLSRSELLNSDTDGGDVRPTTKQRQRSPTPPQPHTLAYPALTAPSGPAPAFQQPTQIISFSYTPARELEFTDSALRYLASPPPRAKLAHGYNRWVRRPETRPRLDGLLRALSAARTKRHPALANGFGAVAWRGVLTRILTAPYEERDGWEMNVMCVDGVLYFEEHLDEARLREKNDIVPRLRLQAYFGYAFESYCTSETPSAGNAPRVNVPQAPGEPPGWSGDVNTNVQWCSVVRTKLGDTRLVIGGEVDCVRGKYTGQTDTFVELKTSMVIRNTRDEARFEKKLLKFYMQSFLLGVPEILVGFRTPAGEVSTMQTFRTVEIPRLVRGKPHGWEPARCLAWGDGVLGFLKRWVGKRGDNERGQTEEGGQSEKGDGEGTGEEQQEEETRREAHPDAAVWRLTFRPGVGVELRKLDDAAVQDVEGGEGDKEEVDRVGFLPRWYWEEVTAPANGNAGVGEGKANGKQG